MPSKVTYAFILSLDSETFQLASSQHSKNSSKIPSKLKYKIKTKEHIYIYIYIYRQQKTKRIDGITELCSSTFSKFYTQETQSSNFETLNILARYAPTYKTES